MENWKIVFTFIFLNVMSLCYAEPIPDPDPNTIQVYQNQAVNIDQCCDDVCENSGHICGNLGNASQCRPKGTCWEQYEKPILDIFRDCNTCDTCDCCSPQACGSPCTNGTMLGVCVSSGAVGIPITDRDNSCSKSDKGCPQCCADLVCGEFDNGICRPGSSCNTFGERWIPDVKGTCNGYDKGKNHGDICCTPYANKYIPVTTPEDVTTLGTPPYDVTPVDCGDGNIGKCRNKECPDDERPIPGDCKGYSWVCCAPKPKV